MKREFDDDLNPGPGSNGKNRNGQGRKDQNRDGQRGYEDDGQRYFDGFDGYGDDFDEYDGENGYEGDAYKGNSYNDNAYRGDSGRSGSYGGSYSGQNGNGRKRTAGGQGRIPGGRQSAASMRSPSGNGDMARGSGYRQRSGRDDGLRVGDSGNRISGSNDRRGQEPPGRPPTGRSAAQTSKHRKFKRIAIMAALEVVFLICIGFYGYALRLNSMVKRPTFDKSQVENKQLSDDQVEHMKGYWTIAIFGVDSRDGNVHKGTNTDVIMLCNINRDTGEVKLASVFRDTYLNTSEKGTYNKINSAYATGGAEQALAALNRNLDLNIVDYVTFNWKSVADGINMLGGVDGVDISKSEFRYINSFITETVKKTGVPSVQLKKPGLQHLDGVQAVAYGRLRLMDTDFARTERQRLIIQKTFEKAKTTDLGLLNRILIMETGQIETSLTFSDFTNLILDLGKYHIGETTGFPFDLTDLKMGKKGDCVIPVTLVSNVAKLHKFLYGKDDYAPTDMVKKISSKVTADYNSYKSGTNTTSNNEKLPKNTEEAIKPSKENGHKGGESASGGTHIGETDEYGNPIKAVKPGETLPDGSWPAKPGETVPGGANPTRPGETVPDGANPTKPGETLPGGAIKPGGTAPDYTAPVKPGDQYPGGQNPTGPGMDSSRPGVPGGSQSNPSNSNTGPGVKPSPESQAAPSPGANPGAPGDAANPGSGSPAPGAVSPGGQTPGGQTQPGSAGGGNVVMVPPPAA